MLSSRASGGGPAGPIKGSSHQMDPFLGEIIMFGGNFAPRGWAFCDGALMPINENQSLYSLLGTTYGGDGRRTFGLPDLTGKLDGKVKFLIATRGIYPSRN